MGSSCMTGETLKDYVTGRDMPDCDDEVVRQNLERLLVEAKGYERADIEVDRWFDIEIDGVREKGRAELVVALQNQPFMTIKCSRGSLVTREREALAASRLCHERLVPYTVVTNGQDAEFLDTLTGQVLATGLEAVPHKNDALKMSLGQTCTSLDEAKRIKEGRVYLAFADMRCPTDCP